MSEPGEDVYVPEPGKVAIKDLDGSVSLVKQGDLAAAQTEGARPATEAEYFGAKHGLAGDIAAGTVGAARGATFGLFDPAFIEATRAVAGDQQAEEYRNTMRLLKETSPNATLGGEIAGAVAPALFGAPAAGGALALGESGLARFGARALVAAPRAAIEGAAIGAGQQLSEDTLANHPFVGTSYLTSAVKGGTIGLLLGAGGAGVLGAAGDKVAQVRNRLFGAGESAGLRAEESAGTRLAEEGGPYRTAGRVEDAAVEQGGRKSIIQRAEDLGNEQAYKATGANQTDWKRLGADADSRAETAQRVGKMLQTETVDGKPLVEALASQEEIANRIAAKQKEVGKSFASMYAEADKAFQHPSMSAIRDGMDALREKYAGTMYGDLEMRGAEDAYARLEKSLGKNPTHTELWNARKEIDGQLKKAYARDKTTGVIPQGEEALRSLRGVVNDELTASAERAGQELGGTLGDRLRLANQLYSDLSIAKSASSRAAARGSGNQAVSITDVIAGATGGLGGLAATGLNMVRRKYGNQIAAHVLDTATRMQGVQRAAARMDELLDRGTKAFVSGSKAGARPMKLATSDEIRALREATRAPEAVTARVASTLGDMPNVAPKIAQEAALAASRGAAWLQQVLPKDSPQIGLTFGKRKDAPISDADRLKATAAIETIADPSIVVDRLQQGRLTPEHISALKYFSPESYEKLRDHLARHATELGKDMSQQQLTKLGILFDEPLTEQDLPENRRAFQASFSQGNQAPGKAGAGGNTGASAMRAGPVNAGRNAAPAFDKLEAGK